MTALAALSLADLRAAIDEFTRMCQDQGRAVGLETRNATLRQLRAELSRRVAEIAAAAAES